MGIALLLHKPGMSVLRTLTRLSLVIPMATTYAVVGLLGQITFNIKYGVVNQLIGFLGFAPVNWIGDPNNAFIAICFWDIWQWTPFCSLVLLAGLTMVPVEVEEAARLETRNWWTVLRYVQFPFLIPGLTAILILRTADTLKLFDMVFTMTRGGPGSATELISLMIQRVGFRGFDQGLASAQAATGKPYIISFVFRPQGRLLDGTSLKDAVAAIDADVVRGLRQGGIAETGGAGADQALLDQRALQTN